MAALAAAFVVVGFSSDEAPPETQGALLAAEIGLTVVFVAEFATRFLAAYDRRRYLRGHWIDLVALVPTVRGVRLLRLLRLLRLVRMFAGMWRALADIERLARHRSLLWLFLAWFAVAVICSTALYLAENGINPAIKTPMDALWWGIVTLTTVGYGDVTPITPEGRFAAAALMILGITLFAAITGTITSFLVSANTPTATPSIPEQIRLLGELQDAGKLTDQEFETKKAELLARM
jgi:voltage-gated potassium channel